MENQFGKCKVSHMQRRAEVVNHLSSILLKFSDYVDELGALLLRSAVGITKLDVVYTTKENHELAEFLFRLGLPAGNLFEQLLGVDEGKAAFNKIEIYDNLGKVETIFFSFR